MEERTEQPHVPTGPLDRPPELERALAMLEALWREKKNPIPMWRALELCLFWEGEDGRLAGPFQPPIWVLLYLAKVAVKVQELAHRDPAPTNDEASPEILKILGFNAQGRSVFREWLKDHLEVAAALVAEGAKDRGISYVDAYRQLADIPQLQFGKRRDPAAEAGRPIEQIVKRGRTRFQRMTRPSRKGPKDPT